PPRTQLGQTFGLAAEVLPVAINRLSRAAATEAFPGVTCKNVSDAVGGGGTLGPPPEVVEELPPPPHELSNDIVQTIRNNDTVFTASLPKQDFLDIPNFFWGVFRGDAQF